MLVPLQVSFSLAVLFLATLLLLSFWRLLHVDLGFTRNNVVLFALDARGITEPGRARVAGFEVLDRIRALPGVESASLSEWPLFSAGGWTASVRLAGREPDPLQAVHLAVSPGFFTTMKIRMIEGRDFDPRDSQPEAPTAVIVNDAFVRRYLGAGPALGRTYHRLSEKGEMLQEIVGVVADTKYNDPRRAAPPAAYVPLRTLGTFQVRSEGDPGALMPVLRDAIAAAHPSLRVFEFSLQESLLANTMLRERLLALLSGFFGVVGLLLAIVGLYGVLNYSVIRRTREIGIRLAIGAQPRSVMRLVMKDVTRQVLAGVVAGLAVGLYLARFVETLLFEVEPLTLATAHCRRAAC